MDTGFTSAGSRILAVAVGLACAATLSLLVASAASAATTLHFFDKQVSSTFRGPNGQPLGPNAVPTVGDSFDNTDLTTSATTNITPRRGPRAATSFAPSRRSPAP